MNDKRVLDIHEAAAYLGVSEKIVRRFVHQGKLRRVTLSENFLFDKVDLDQLIESEKTEVKVAPKIAPGGRSRKATDRREKPYEWAEKYGVRR